jgi:hypothetical protein
VAKNQSSEINAVAIPTTIATISSSMPIGKHLQGQVLVLPGRGISLNRTGQRFW